MKTTKSYSITLLAIILWTSTVFTQTVKKSEIEIGNTAPNFVATDIHGKRIELEGLREKLVILAIDKLHNPTISEEERNKVQDFYNEYSKQGLEIIRIGYKSGIPFFITKSYVESRARENQAKRQTKWIVIIDWECSIKELFQVSNKPLVLVLDKQGIIKYKKNEELTANSSLEELIKKLLIE